MEYYPSATKGYGGYTILADFGEDGSVRISCDFLYFNPSQVTSSTYRVIQATGPVLTFDTRNEIFHFFSEPANEFFGDLGTGMGGDYEFLILECTPEKIVLQGRKTQNRIIMYPVPDNITWVEYLKQIQEVERQAFPASYDVQVNGKTAYAISQQHRLFTITHEDGSQEYHPFIYTPEGLNFYEPLNVEGEEVQSLKWDNTSLSFAGNNITLKAQELPDGYLKYEEILGNYQFNYYNTSKANVTLKEEIYKYSFIMEGLPWNIRVLYLGDIGGIAIESQLLEENIYLCPWALDNGGSLTTASGAGMVATHKDGTFTFTSKDSWGPADSFIVYDMLSRTALLQLPYVKNLVKK